MYPISCLISESIHVGLVLVSYHSDSRGADWAPGWRIHQQSLLKQRDGRGTAGSDTAGKSRLHLRHLPCRYLLFNVISIRCRTIAHTFRKNRGIYSFARQKHKIYSLRTSAHASILLIRQNVTLLPLRQKVHLALRGQQIPVALYAALPHQGIHGQTLALAVTEVQGRRTPSTSLTIVGGSELPDPPPHFANRLGPQMGQHGEAVWVHGGLLRQFTR